MPGKPADDPRVNVYIDGYNFYVPLSTMEEQGYELSWCDFLALAGGLTKRLAAEHPTEFGTCRLGSVKYFTATIPKNMPKDRGDVERKYSWLDALHYHTGGKVEVIHGTSALASIASISNETSWTTSHVAGFLWTGNFRTQERRRFGRHCEFTKRSRRT